MLVRTFGNRAPKNKHNFFVGQLRGVPTLKWEGINVRLSFCNLAAYVSTMRFKWVWGRTSWVGTAPYWCRDSPAPCPFSDLHHAASHHDIPPSWSFTDLFSLIAECPVFQGYREAFFQLWGQAAVPVSTWFSHASRSDRRNFIRSLVPTTLVSKLLQHFSATEIRTLVNARDKDWSKFGAQPSPKVFFFFKYH